MRKRYQNGRVVQSSDGRHWIGKWKEEGHDRSKVLGKVGKLSKSKAREAMARIVQPINERTPGTILANITVKTFVESTYFPFFERKWKRSTAMVNRDRVSHHIVGEFGGRELRTVSREELQQFLERKAALSFSTTAHLRWDLKQIFDLAEADGIVRVNPATVLFTPRECARPTHRSLSIKEVQDVLTLLPLRERLIAKLAIMAGMRPGEILALTRGSVDGRGAAIRARIYRGEIDTPKTAKSVRVAALSSTVREDLTAWLERDPNGDTTEWLFPSENPEKPLSRDNAIRRYIQPKLAPAGYGWVNFHVMRRTHSSLMRELGVDPKIVADQQGHTLDVNLNVYTESSIESRIAAVETLGSALVN
jgi:integrase